MYKALKHLHHNKSWRQPASRTVTARSLAPMSWSNVLGLGRRGRRWGGEHGATFGPIRIPKRLEHLLGSALGFRNLTNYIARSLLETGGFRPRPHPALVKSRPSWGSAKDTTETGNQ